MPEALSTVLVMLDLVLDARAVPAPGTPEACFLARVAGALEPLAPTAAFVAAASAVQAEPTPAAWRLLKAEAAALKLALFLRLDRELADAA